MTSLQRGAEAHWATTDKVLHALSKANRLPLEPPIAEADGFATLVTSIVHQQVSMAAARTIHGRLVRALGGKITPRRIANRSPDQLRAAGLSRGKAAYILDLADRTLRGDVEFDQFGSMPDGDILAELTQVKGIGDWTAKMFLMFHLHRPNVLPHEDLGLRLAVQDAYGIPLPKTAAFMLERHDAWSPYCSVASRVLWQSRRPDEPEFPPKAGRPQP